MADRGTLFLDEVGEIPLELQSKMLRVLQEGEFERVGDDRPRKVDVRIIAATNRDLQKEMQEGRFREDLYFRLDVFPIEVPPLREREGDVAPLAHHFTRLASKRFNKPVSRLSDDNLETLEAYDWPGNVRELQNVIERAVIRARSGKLEFDLAPARPTAKPAKAKRASVAPLSEVKAIERERILEALERTHWKIYGPGGAAELLGVKPTTLASRLKSLGIEKPS